MIFFFLTLVPNAIAILGTYSFLDWLWKRKTFFRTKGTVVSFDESTDDDNGWYYHAVVRFDYDGKEYRKADPLGTGWKLVKIGQDVPVRFPHGQPEMASIEWLWIPTVYLIAAIFGLLLTTYILLRYNAG